MKRPVTSLRKYLNKRSATRLHSEHGSALVELSLVMPILVFLFAGVVDYCLQIQQGIQIQEAARAGTAYGTITGNSEDTAGMQTAATNASSGMSGFNPVATFFWTCTAGGAHVTSTTSCSGVTPLMYIQVQTSANVASLITYPGLATSLAQNGLSVIRVPYRQ